jgi:ELWxxDGT repeat protein
LTVAGGRLFFLAIDGTTQYDQLVVTDGTGPGTQELDPALEASAPLALGSTLLFVAYDTGAQRSGLWTTDGTASGTQLVAPLPSSSVVGLAAVGGRDFFELDDFLANQYELWTSDGTAGGTGLVTTLPGAGSNFTASGSRLFFTDSDGTHGTELWTSDGTAAGTGMVADIRHGSLGSSPASLTDVNGTLFFTALDGTSSYRQLWRSDGTAAGTFKLSTALKPYGLAAEGGRLLFTAVDRTTVPDFTTELGQSDGTVAGTTALATLPSSTPGGGLALVGGEAFFGLTPSDSSDLQLWTSDGTPADTALVATLPGGASDLSASAGRLDFVSSDPVNGTELWSSDGTANGTAMVQDINPGPNGSNPASLTDVSGTLFFTADDGTHGVELWHTLPAAAPIVTTVNEGSPFTDTAGSFTDDVASGPWTATVDYGDGTGPQPLALGSNNTFNLQHTYEDDGSDAITVTVANALGRSGSATLPVTVLNVPPTAAIVNAPATSPEGTPIVLSGSATDPSAFDVTAGFTYAWSVTKDGQPFATGSGDTLTFTPNDEGEFVVTLTAFDEDGSASTPVSQEIPVTTVAPSVAILGSPQSESEGTPISLTAQATDPSPVDAAAGFTYAWSVTKDSQPFATGTGSGIGFTPDDEGTYVVTATATDDDGDVSAPASQTINVMNVPPSPAIQGLPASVPEGGSVVVTATATDPSPVDTAAGFGFTWTVTQDGHAYATGTGTGFTFAPNDDGTYVVSLTAQDEDGVTGTTSATLEVTPVAPTAMVTGDSAGVRGQPRAVSLSAIDPSSLDTAAGFAYLVDWGDGSTVQSVPVRALSQVRHDFTATGQYTVQVRAVDADGTIGAPVSWPIAISAALVEPDPLRPGGTVLAIGGTTGHDHIRLTPSGPGHGVRLAIDDTIVGTFAPTDAILIYTQGGCDDLSVAASIHEPVIIIPGDPAVRHDLCDLVDAVLDLLDHDADPERPGS